MCQTCFEEAGSPSVLNAKIIEASEAIKDLYLQEGCSCGGYAHIVVDDWNLEDHHIKYCIEIAEKGDKDYIDNDGKVACLNTLNLLMDLPEHQRYTALALADGFINIPDNFQKCVPIT